jgi:hypothetical protein
MYSLLFEIEYHKIYLCAQDKQKVLKNKYLHGPAVS